MKSSIAILVFVCLVLFSCASVKSQDTITGRIAILPFESVGIDPVYIQSAESILRLELGRETTMDIISEKRTKSALPDSDCVDIQCAIKVGQSLNASQIVTCKLMTLGEKIIAQYKLFDIGEKKLLVQDQATASYIEDLDMVMKRVAMSVVQHEPIIKTAEVGAITEHEAEVPRRRGAHTFGGFSFGYLYPQNGYDDVDRSFTMDFRTGAEFQDYAVGMQLFLRKGFGVNIFGTYLLSRKDVCPYIGGAFGFHWISHSDDSQQTISHNGSYNGDVEEKKKDGFELAANTGLRLFRTYNFQIIINLAYAYTFNDFDDQAIIFTIGLLR